MRLSALRFPFFFREAKNLLRRGGESKLGCGRIARTDFLVTSPRRGEVERSEGEGDQNCEVGTPSPASLISFARLPLPTGGGRKWGGRGGIDVGGSPPPGRRRGGVRGGGSGGKIR